MKILLIGGNGMLGPWVTQALEERHELRVTDVNEPPAGFRHECVRLDIADAEQVMRAARGIDAVVILSASRRDRRAAFDVNSLGVYNALEAARANGIRRVVNTGPRGQLASDRYAEWDFGLSPEMPPQPGRTLYWIRKAWAMRWRGCTRAGTASAYRPCSSITCAIPRR